MFYFVTGYGFDRKNGEKWKGCATATLEKKKSTEKNIVENFKERNKKRNIENWPLSLEWAALHEIKRGLCEI